MLRALRCHGCTQVFVKTLIGKANIVEDDAFDTIDNVPAMKQLHDGDLPISKRLCAMLQLIQMYKVGMIIS